MAVVLAPGLTAPGAPAPAPLEFIGAVTWPPRGRPWRAAAATAYSLEPLERPDVQRSGLGPARERSATGKHSLRAGAPARDLWEGQQAPRPAQDHSLCSLLWRWGLAVSQEQYQAAIHWSQILPRGPGLPPKTVERAPGDRPQARAGRPDTGVSLLPRLLEPRVQGRWGYTEASLPGRVSKFGPPSSPSECPRLCPDCGGPAPVP